MKGNWDRGTNSSLISKRSNKIILAFVMVVTLMAAMAAPVTVSATYEPPDIPEEELGSVEITPYAMFSVTSGGGLALLAYGDQVFHEEFTYDRDSTGGGGLVLGSHQELLKDHTYELILAITGTANSNNTKFNQIFGFSITESLPKLTSEIAPSPTNSIGIDYSDLYKAKIGSNGSFLRVHIYFSTANGYVDNSPLGDVYINFLLNNLDVNIYELEISSVQGSCVYDPDGSYYTNIWGEELDQTADEFLDNTNLLAEKEREISGMANDIRSNVIDKFGDMINTTVNFVSPAATFSGEGNTSIYGAATSFIGLYNSIISSLPPIVQALFTVVPMLAFLAWLFGFGRSL